METKKNYMYHNASRSVGCVSCEHVAKGWDEHPCRECCLSNGLEWYNKNNSEAKTESNYPVESVNHPEHYQGKNECIDVMLAMFGKEAVKHFCMCNAYKYRFRADRKNGDEDIKKAEWYETKLIELVGCDE